MNPIYKYIIVVCVLILMGVAVFLTIHYGVTLPQTENYRIAKDESSQQMFAKLKSDLEKIYPHDLSNIDMKGLVSCIPEDSYTENKKNVCICLRNKQGTFLPYSKILKIAVHELAHVMSKQHDPEHKTVEFHTNHRLLINKAKELGHQLD